MKNIIFIAAVSFLTGCYQKIDQSIIHTYSNDQICNGAAAWRANGDGPILEAVKRGLIEERDISAIKNKQIRVGMNKCTVVALTHYPTSQPLFCGSVNTSGGANGFREQWVYRSCQSNNKTFYIYFENGVVNSWQNW